LRRSFGLSGPGDQDLAELNQPVRDQAQKVRKAEQVMPDNFDERRRRCNLRWMIALRIRQLAMAVSADGSQLTVKMLTCYVVQFNASLVVLSADATTAV